MEMGKLRLAQVPSKIMEILTELATKLLVISMVSTSESIGTASVSMCSSKVSARGIGILWLNPVSSGDSTTVLTASCLRLRRTTWSKWITALLTGLLPMQTSIHTGLVLSHILQTEMSDLSHGRTTIICSTLLIFVLRTLPYLIISQRNG